MDSNVLCWDVQCVSKFGYIILLEIPKETTNGWVNILVIERVWDILIVIASVSFMIWVIPIQTASTLPWTILILIWPKRENETIKMLELNITAQCPYKMSVFRAKGKFVPTTEYCTYNKWELCYEEILKILWCKMEAIHQILEAISLYGRVVSWFK